MNNSLTTNSWSLPQNIAIIGGGRWARVYIQILNNLIPYHIKLSVHSIRNSQGMSKWISEADFSREIEVSSTYPELPKNSSSAIIIVNSAHDHESAAEWAILQKYSVFVEKPICVKFSSAQRLVDLSMKIGNYLASSSVFLFANYLENFCNIIPNNNEIISLEILWSDPLLENRYGEIKKYDHSLPIYCDLIPHIFSILKKILCCDRVSFKNLILQSGGSHLKLNLISDLIPCEINISRNANVRNRIINVFTYNEFFTLDFSNEPGIIKIKDKEFSADSEWNKNPKPLEMMLKTFLTAAAGSHQDCRLNLSYALDSCYLMKQIENSYNFELYIWLFKQIKNKNVVLEEDLVYALSEILMLNDRDSVISINQRVNYLFHQIQECGIMNGMLTLENIYDVIQKIIKKGIATSYTA